MKFQRVFFFLMVTAVLAAAGSGGAQDLLEQGLAAQKAKQHEQAVELFGQFLQQSPQHPEAWRARAQSLEALGRHQEALRDLDTGLQSNPKDISLMVAKGKLLGNMERRQEAIAVFTQVLALESSNVEALKERAENLINEAELDRARADLGKAKSLAPADPWIYHKLGMASLCLNRYREAAEAFSTAIRLAPENPLFYFSRGEVYLRHLDSKDKAVADFEKGCSLGHSLCCHELEMLKSKQPKTSGQGK